MKLYTEEQVREMLKQQEQSISDNASVGNGTVFTKISVKWPAPIQAIPVERVKEVISGQLIIGNVMIANYLKKRLLGENESDGK